MNKEQKGNREGKKKAAMSMKERRAAKRSKKENKGLLDKEKTN